MSELEEKLKIRELLKLEAEKLKRDIKIKTEKLSQLQGKIANLEKILGA